jgi:hypothetical protein
VRNPTYRAEAVADPVRAAVVHRDGEADVGRVDGHAGLLHRLRAPSGLADQPMGNPTRRPTDRCPSYRCRVTESYLLILGDRQAIAWVLREQRMAFPPTAHAEVNRLAVGDELLIYTTRGAFRNPTRHRGRVIGCAAVTSNVERLDPPVEFGGREFPRGCRIDVCSLAPWGQGVELQPLVEQLAAFPNSKAWSTYLRRPLLHLPESDAAILKDRLKERTGHRMENLHQYLVYDRPPLTQVR